MREFPDGHFDLAMVDPPYGIGIGEAGGTVGKYGTSHVAKAWDSTPPKPEYFFELRRVSRHQIIWGGNYFALPPTKCFIVWDKVQPAPTFAQCELAWTSFDKPARITCVEHSSAVGVFQSSSAPDALVGVVSGRVTSNNVQNSFLGFGPSGQTRDTSNPPRGVGRTLFGPWEVLAGELRPGGRWHCGRDGRFEAVRFETRRGVLRSRVLRCLAFFRRVDTGVSRKGHG